MKPARWGRRSFLVFWFLVFGFLIVSYPGLSSAVPTFRRVSTVRPLRPLEMVEKNRKVIGFHCSVVKDT